MDCVVYFTKQYEPGAYGKSQPCMLYGAQPATPQLIYSRAVLRAQKGINDEPHTELDIFRQSDSDEA